MWKKLWACWPLATHLVQLCPAALFEMPLFRRSGCSIHFAVRGAGFPVLLLAPGGMRSTIANWANQPYDAWSKLCGNKFKVIAMDQRNGGESQGSLGDGWETMRDDQLALLDHLHINQCLLLGSCIGPSYQLALMKHSPDRFPAAVMMQPIGLAHCTTEPGNAWDGLNVDATKHWYGDWAREMEQAGRFSKPELGQLYEALFRRCAGPDFVFSVSRPDAARLAQRMLVFMGKDIFHPSQIAREIARVCPNAELVDKWRDEDYTPE